MPLSESSSDTRVEKRTRPYTDADEAGADGQESEDDFGEMPQRRFTSNHMETLLLAAGTAGIWNYVIYFTCAWGCFNDPLQTVSYQFLGSTPNYWCHIPELTNASWTQEQIVNLSLPDRKDNEITSCSMYNFNYSLAAQLGYEESMIYFKDNFSNVSTIGCSTRDFNSSEPLTAVSKWDLVCDRRAVYSTTQSASQVGKLIGSLLIGYFVDRFGRKSTLMGCSCLYFVFGVAAAFAPTVTVYIVFKICISATCMVFSIAGLTLAFELCSTSQRSFVGSLFGLPWAFGYMALPVIAYYVRSFRDLQIALTLPILSLIPAYFILPESPRWLVLQGRVEESISVLEKIAKINKRKIPSRLEIMDLMSKINADQQSKAGKKVKPSDTKRKINFLKKLFKIWTVKGWRLKLAIIFFAWFSASFIYYGVSLNPPDLKTGKFMFVFLGGVLEIPSYILLWPMIRYFGRKKSLVSLHILCAISILGSIWFIKEDGASSTETSAFKWLLSLSLFGKFAVTAAFQLISLYSNELIPTEFRPIVYGEANVFARIGSICSPYIVDLLGEVKHWMPSAIFGGMSVLVGIVLTFLPETRNSELRDYAED